MSQYVETSIAAYQEVKEAGEDASLRRRVASALFREPMTNHQLLQKFPEHSANAIRPRVNELVRMGCVEREGKRRNPSGHEAYVHRLTTRGVRYLSRELTPEPGPTISELQSEVVDTAREVVSGSAELDELRMALLDHDDAKRQMDPDWAP